MGERYANLQNDVDVSRMWSHLYQLQVWTIIMQIIIYLFGFYLSGAGIGYIWSDYKDYGKEAFRNQEGYAFILAGLVLIGAALLMM